MNRYKGVRIVSGAMVIVSSNSKSVKACTEQVEDMENDMTDT